MIKFEEHDGLIFKMLEKPVPLKEKDTNVLVEIVGIFVEEGSKDWALYQMMQGEGVCHKKSPSIVYYKHAGCIRLEVRHNHVDYVSIDDWLNRADKNGWQIYKEPKIEPPKEPDYVICKRCDGTGYEIKPDPAPKFVVVPINISGTVRQAYNEDGTIDDEQFQLLPNGIWDGTEMFISFGALDTHTRELVESLLEAQGEEE